MLDFGVMIKLKVHGNCEELMWVTGKVGVSLFACWNLRAKRRQRESSVVNARRFLRFRTGWLGLQSRPSLVEVSGSGLDRGGLGPSLSDPLHSLPCPSMSPFQPVKEYWNAVTFLNQSASRPRAPDAGRSTKSNFFLA
jgi:hypothetical protein